MIIIGLPGVLTLTGLITETSEGCPVL